MARLVGRAEFSKLNARITASANAVTPLIVAHRGTGLGSIPENTTAAVVAAARQGADIVEIDVVRSTDGTYFVFHELYEPMHFGFERRLGELDAAQIRKLRYRSLLGNRPKGVTELAELLGNCPDVLLNLDHSWRYWPDLFEVLDAHADPTRILLKCPPAPEPLKALAGHHLAYPVIPRVTDPADVNNVLGYSELNVVGFELIAVPGNPAFLSRDYIAGLQAQELLVFVNALSLVTEFGGYDDEVSVLGDPDEGWGRLMDFGADIIQTDWPDLLHRYRATRLTRTADAMS